MNKMDLLYRRLQAFKRAFYLSLFFRSASLALALVLTFFLIISLSEYFFWFSPTVRALLFFSYLFVFVILLLVWVVWPALKVFLRFLQFSNKRAADFIGNRIPTIRDRLLNTLQLIEMPNSELARASVEQNTRDLLSIPFEQAIDTKTDYRYARLLLPPLLFLLFLLSCHKKALISGATRIYNHQKYYAKPMPFEITLLDSANYVVEGNDLNLAFLLKGKEIPAFFDFYSTDGRTARLYVDGDTLRYTLKSVVKDIQFNLRYDDFISQDFALKVIRTPKIVGLLTYLNYPLHTRLKNTKLVNTYSYNLPYGTDVIFEFKTTDVDSMLVLSNVNCDIERVSTSVFRAKLKARQSQQIVFSFLNIQNPVSSQVAVDITTEMDAKPVISLSYSYDSLNRQLAYYGQISDDYGFSSLQFKYRVLNSDRASDFITVHIPFQPFTLRQSYFGKHDFAELILKTPSTKAVEFFTIVYDNDIYNKKSAQSPVYKIVILSEAELKIGMSQQAEKSKETFEQIKGEIGRVRQELSELQKKFGVNRKFEWNDLKRLEELQKEQKRIEERVRELERSINDLNKSRMNFSKLEDERLVEKVFELQRLMEQILDNKTKELYESLQKKFEEQIDPVELQKLTEKLKNATSDFENEVDKALKFFKELQFEMQSKELAKEFDKLSEVQDSLLQKQHINKNQSDQLNLEEQKALDEKIEQALEQLDSLSKMSEELENPVEMKDEKDLSDQIKNQMNDLENSMKQGSRSNKDRAENRQKQKKLSQQLKKMSEGLQANLLNAEQEQLEEDIASLTRTLENLIRVSFDQEEIMVGLRKIRSIDPSFNRLSQQQLKLNGDFSLIQDSLLALTNRIIQIKRVVTDEVRKVNEKISSAMDNLRNKRISPALADQQGAMTSMNNLAVMLSEILEQLQNQSMGNGSACGNKSKPNRGKRPSLSDLQQSLNQQLENLKKSGKSGRELSQELRKLAAQQEMIRQMMKQFKPGKHQPGQDGKGGDQADKMMDDSKNDMINKKLTDELINRQREILTRLLESEQAERERGMKQEREAERPKNTYEIQKDKLLEQYLKEKSRQVEELQKKSPTFLPFYKRNIDRYTQKITS